MSVCKVCGIEKRDTCHAYYEKRIAELEAEVERLKSDRCVNHFCVARETKP